MTFLQRLFGTTNPHDAGSDEKYERAMRLSDEVRATLRKTAEDPFTVIALDLARGVFKDGADPALVADAHLMIESSRVFHGPPPPRNK